MSTTTQVLPVVGMGATLQYPSDCYPYTIVEVNATGTRIKVTSDKYTRTDKNGQSESQEYTYETVEGAKPEIFSLRKNGRYHRVGETINGAPLFVGRRRAYQSPHL